MAIDFDTLFTQIGRVGRAHYVLAGGQAGLPAAFTSLFAEFDGQHDIIGSIESRQDSLIRQESAAGLLAVLQPVAQQALLDAVKADQPSQARTVPLAIAELIRQMDANAKSVKACTIGLTPTALSGNTGTGVLVTSTKRGDGLVQQNTIAETGRLSCVADSYTLSATAGQETFVFVGADPDTARIWDYDWPLGSGAGTTIPLANPSFDANSSLNVLTNSDFETWTTDTDPVPANWHTGQTWGTELQQSGTGFSSSYALQFNAATGTAIYQQFNTTVSDGTSTTAGTSFNPAALNSLAVNLWARKGTGTITTGVLTVELVDGSGTVVNDEQGTANSFTIDLTALTTSYVAYNSVFRLPAVTPSTLRLRLRLSTALAGGTVLVDDVCMAPLVAAYPGGPGLRVFPGVTPFKIGDGWTIATTNNRGGASYGATFQTLFDRLFGMVAQNQLLPYDASPTHADTLITDA